MGTSLAQRERERESAQQGKSPEIHSGHIYHSQRESTYLHMTEELIENWLAGQYFEELSESWLSGYYFSICD